MGNKRPGIRLVTVRHLGAWTEEGSDRKGAKAAQQAQKGRYRTSQVQGIRWRETWPVDDRNARPHLPVRGHSLLGGACNVNSKEREAESSMGDVISFVRGLQ